MCAVLMSRYAACVLVFTIAYLLQTGWVTENHGLRVFAHAIAMLVRSLSDLDEGLGSTASDDPVVTSAFLTRDPEL